MAVATDRPLSKWRNFAAWSAVGGLVFVVTVAVSSWLGHGDALDELLRSGSVDPKAALALLLTMLVLGISSRNTPLGWRSFRNFVLLSAAAGTVAALVLTGFRPLADAGAFGAMNASRWTAAAVGLVLMFLAALISLLPSAARRGWTRLDAEQIETLGERSHLLFLSWITIAAMGVMLILLGLAGPGSVLPAEAALAGALLLAAVVTALSFFVWRLMDELDRTLSYETGNMAFYLILFFGGGWAMLAHLGFVAAAAPLDWLTMFTVIIFVASFIAAGWRKLLTL
jgi:hypothetical protein